MRACTPEDRGRFVSRVPRARNHRPARCSRSLYSTPLRLPLSPPATDREFFVLRLYIRVWLSGFSAGRTVLHPSTLSLTFLRIVSIIRERRESPIDRRARSRINRRPNMDGIIGRSLVIARSSKRPVSWKDEKKTCVNYFAHRRFIDEVYVLFFIPLVKGLVSFTNETSPFCGDMHDKECFHMLNAVSR